MTTFNRTNDNIEWAPWSWNPVTGCKHGCAYCYARDIAMRFSGTFEPAFHPERLDAPVKTRFPKTLEGIPGGLNVFVCSMADLFGAWVPREWIQAVIDACRGQPWNFLFLTKNPARYAEFEFPENAWLGATVDGPARMEPTAAAFADLDRKGSTNLRWLSMEPLVAPVNLTGTRLYQWIVIGGRSRSSGEPAFQPAWSWVEIILRQARPAGIKVYFKPNLTARPREFPEAKL